MCKVQTLHFTALLHGNPIQWWLTCDTSTEITLPECVYDKKSLTMSCLLGLSLKSTNSLTVRFNITLLGKTEVSYTVFTGILSHKT